MTFYLQRNTDPPGAVVHFSLFIARLHVLLFPVSKNTFYPVLYVWFYVALNRVLKWHIVQKCFHFHVNTTDVYWQKYLSSLPFGVLKWEETVQTVRKELIQVNKCTSCKKVVRATALNISTIALYRIAETCFVQWYR